MSKKIFELTIHERDDAKGIDGHLEIEADNLIQAMAIMNELEEAKEALKLGIQKLGEEYLKDKLGL